MSERNDLVKLLLEEGVDDLHSWRCAHPDRYGKCRCVRDLADALLDAGWRNMTAATEGATS